MRERLINCGHYPIGFVPGISVIRGEVQHKEENDKQYAESQEQRRLERELRYAKRDLAVMKAQGADPKDIERQKERVQDARANLATFCDETGRVRRRDREYTPVNATWPDT